MQLLDTLHSGDCCLLRSSTKTVKVKFSGDNRRLKPALCTFIYPYSNSGRSGEFFSMISPAMAILCRLSIATISSQLKKDICSKASKSRIKTFFPDRERSRYCSYFVALRVVSGRNRIRLARAVRSVLFEVYVKRWIWNTAVLNKCIPINWSNHSAARSITKLWSNH